MADTREKLIELLNDHTCLEDKDDCAEECSACIADHLIANGVTVQEWIPVSEPPKVNTVVWGYAKYYPHVSYHNREVRWDGKWWTDTNGVRMIVTYWMPLPEPPKEGEK